MGGCCDKNADVKGGGGGDKRDANYTAGNQKPGGNATGPSNKNNDKNNDDHECGSDEEDSKSNKDTSSVHSARSNISVRSTRSNHVVTSQGSIPKSQDAQQALKTPTSASLNAAALRNARGTGRDGGPHSPQASRLTPSALAHRDRDPVIDSGGGGGDTAPLIYDGIVFDPQDAVDMRNERFHGRKQQRHHITGNVGASHQPGHKFVINDFVIRTMEEELVPSGSGPGGAGGGVKDAPLLFAGDRELRNSEARCLLGHGARVKAIAVAPDERTFVSCSVEDNDILQQFVNGRGELFFFTGHGAAVVSLSFSRDGHYFASTSRDASIAVWDAQQGTVHRRVRWLDADGGGGGSIPIANSFSYNGHYIVAGYQDRVCRVWDLEKNAVITHFSEHEGIVICVSCHPSEMLCASGGADKNVFIWNLESGNVAFKLLGHDNAVISVNFTPSGDSLVTSDDRSCKLWKVATGTLVLNINVNDIVPASTLKTLTGSNSNSNANSVANLNSALAAGRRDANSGSGALARQTSTSSMSNGSGGAAASAAKPPQVGGESSLGSGNGSGIYSDMPRTNSDFALGENSKSPTQESSSSSSSAGGSGGPTTLPGQVMFSSPGTPTSRGPEGGALAGLTTALSSTNLGGAAACASNSSSNNFSNLGGMLRDAINGRNSLATAKRTFQSTAAISQRIAFTVSCPCPGAFSTGYVAIASTAKMVHIISIQTGREEMSFTAKAPVFALACGRDETIMFGDTFGNVYVAELR